MQRIAPPTGVRNPNGHTEATVLRALRGQDGTRRMTFRYELLDSTDAFIRDLDDAEVNECRITQNWLADIKRTASFRIRSAAEPIDYLSNRIKPWVRLHLPPYGPQDWVEWPQGVFLLTAPAREADESGTVWRDVEGYDQLQVLDDDQVPIRFSTAGLVEVTDTFVRDVADAWGTADTGQTWVDNTIADTTVGASSSDGGYGFVVLGAAPSTVRVQYLPFLFQDVDIRARVAVDQTATGDSFLPSVLMRWAGGNDYYRLRLRFTTGGAVQLDVTHGVTQIGATEAPGVSYTPGAWINVRARVVGQMVQGRVWADGAVEPVEWGIERDITSDPIPAGICGFTASAFGANTNTDPEFRYGLFELDDNPTGLVTMAVHHILAIQAGIRQVAVTPSTETLSGVREWEPGTSKLAIVNDLLGSIAYESLSFDEDGTAVVQPYVSPQERPPEYTYADDHESVMLPQVVQERDLHAIPNRWVASSGEPDEEPITVVFTNSDPASPTSTVRRGRTITRFDDEEDVTSEPAMIEKVARLAFEGSQVYEAVEFQTALMPIHSGNDVYSVRFDPLAVAAKFSEHTWEMDLDATAMMTHRARRVISLSPASDPSIVVGDVTVDGALEAGNIAFGVQSVTPVANAPTPHQITGLDLQGSGPVRVQVTPETGVPGSTFVEAAARNPSPDDFTIWVYRTNTTSTNIHYLAIRGA